MNIEPSLTVIPVVANTHGRGGKKDRHQRCKDLLVYAVIESCTNRIVDRIQREQ